MPSDAERVWWREALIVAWLRGQPDALDAITGGWFADAEALAEALRYIEECSDDQHISRKAADALKAWEK